MGSSSRVKISPAIASEGFDPARAVRKPVEHFEALVAVWELVGDLLAVTVGTLGSFYIYAAAQIGRQLHYSANLTVPIAVVFGLVFVFMLDHAGGYRRGNSLLRIRETERVLRVSMQAFALVFPVTFFLSFPFSRWTLTLAMVLVPLAVIAEKQVLLLLIRQLHCRGYGVHNVLIYGAGATGRRLFSALIRSPRLGFNPVAIVDDNANLDGQVVYEYGYRRERCARVVAGPLTAESIRAHGATMVVVGIPSLSRDRLDSIAAHAFAAQARIAFVPQLSYGKDTLTDCVDIDGVLIASLFRTPRRYVYEFAKRAFDFSVALLLLALSSPLWALLSVLIRWDSRGPVFFHQLRVGREGRTFHLYKFRTMWTNAPPYQVHPTCADDPRVTRVGRWLRRTSLDELPQLINILKGEMSLVGPRPEMPFIVEQYDDRQRQRLSVIPGLTGLWQISADRAFLIHENIYYDLYYIRNRNFFMDVAILLHTLAFAARGV